MTTTTHKAKPSAPAPDIVTLASYPATCDNPMTCNNPTSTTDANGNVTSYGYDPTTGLVTNVTLPAPSGGAIQPQTRYNYTSISGVSVLTGISQCHSQATCAGTADEVKTTIGYNSNLLPTSVSKGAGDGSLSTSVQYSYDAVGNVTAIDGPLPGSADTTTITYGDDRQPTLIVSASPGHDNLNRRAVRTTYDVAGQPTLREVGTVDANGNNFNPLLQSGASYDNDGRKIQDTQSTPGGTYKVTQYSYDALNRLTCATVRMNPGSWTSQSDACQLAAAGPDGPDRISFTHYDEVGRTDYVTSAAGTAVATTERLSYTPNGKTASVTDANGNVTSYAYDGFDRALRTCYQTASCTTAGDYEELGYDANGNINSRRLRDGQSLTYDYDALGRLHVEHRPGTSAVERDATYTYDLLGELTRAEDPNGWFNIWTYDALGRVTEESSNVTSNTLEYDLAGRRTQVRWPDGMFILYEYDVLGELTAVRENGSPLLATLYYNDLGQRTGLARPNLAQTTYSYSGAYLTGMSHDLAGTANDLTIALGYNAAGQINSRATSNDAYSWTGQANVVRPYAVNGLNQYIQSGSVNPVYDARGNLTQAGGPTFSYDTRNQLYSSGAGTFYYHDPAGMLGYIARTDGSTLLLGYVGNQLMTEINADGSVARRYAYLGPDEPLMWYEGPATGDRRYLHTDERGSVIAVTDGGGNPIAINTYDEFGIPGANNLGRFQYTGQKWIPELGLYDYKARMYSPSLGRFMQTDPIGYGDGLNWYNYVGGEPVNGVDPSGLAGGEVLVTAGGLYGSFNGITGGSYVPDADFHLGIALPSVAKVIQPPQNDASSPGMGHNNPPPEVAEGEEVVVTAARATVQIGAAGIRVITVVGGAIIGDILFPSPAGDGKDYIGPNDPRRRLGTHTVDRSDEIRRLQAARAAKAQAERSKGNSGWFGFFYNLVRALTGG